VLDGLLRLPVRLTGSRIAQFTFDGVRLPFMM
jgi:hypothetical protein